MLGLRVGKGGRKSYVIHITYCQLAVRCREFSISLRHRPQRYGLRQTGVVHVEEKE